MRPVRVLIVALSLSAVGLTSCTQETTDVSSVNWSSIDANKARNAKPAPTPRILPQTFFAAGRMLEKQGNTAGAIAQFERAIAADPRYAAAYNRLGIIYQRLHRFTDAEQALTNGINAAPRSVVLRNNLGRCYYLQGRVDEAEDQFRAALDMTPDFQRARGNLALLLARTDRLTESVRQFNKIVSPARSYYNVGVIRLEMRDYVGARRNFRESLDMDPTNAGAAEGLQRATRLASEQLRRPAAVAGAEMDNDLAPAP